MKNYLIVVDMQNDFIDGALGTAEAVAIVDRVAEKIRSFDGEVIFTRDTHAPDYLETQEGRKLPVVHCVRSARRSSSTSRASARRSSARSWPRATPRRASARSR